MDVGPVLWFSVVPGFLLGLVAWAISWVVLWTGLEDYTRRIQPNGRLDKTLVMVFFMSLILLIVGMIILIAFLTITHLLLPFVLVVASVVFISWFTYRFSLPPALPVEIDI